MLQCTWREGQLPKVLKRFSNGAPKMKFPGGVQQRSSRTLLQDQMSRSLLNDGTPRHRRLCTFLEFGVTHYEKTALLSRPGRQRASTDSCKHFQLRRSTRLGRRLHVQQLTVVKGRTCGEQISTVASVSDGTQTSSVQSSPRSL